MQRVGDARPRHMGIESRLKSRCDPGETSSARDVAAENERSRRLVWNHC